MKYFFLAIFLAVSAVSFSYAEPNLNVTPSPSTPTTGAPTYSISGDDVCGKTTPCELSDAKKIFQSALRYVAWIGSIVLVAVVVVRLAWSPLARILGKDPESLKNASKQAGNAIIGFLIMILALTGLVAAMLKVFGVESWVLQIFNLFSFLSVEYAAAQQEFFTDPLGNKGIYEIIVGSLNVAMKFFVYPSLIAAWVASGFKFIQSQGNPEGLKTARSWILITVIATVLIFMTQGFILAIRGTADKVIGNTLNSSTDTTTQAVQSGAQATTPQERAQASSDLSARAQAQGLPFPSTQSGCLSFGVSFKMCSSLFPSSQGGTSNCAGLSENQREACFAAQTSGSASNNGCDPQDTSCGPNSQSSDVWYDGGTEYPYNNPLGEPTYNDRNTTPSQEGDIQTAGNGNQAPSDISDWEG